MTEQIKKKAIHVTHCLTEEMIGDFFTKPLQGSLFIKMRNYVMGSEEPGYQVLPRSVLSNHNTTMGIRKQKFIGTRKHNSEASKMGHKHMTKDSDGSARKGAIKNIHGTTPHTTSDDRVSIGGDDTKGKQRGQMNDGVEPRSYRDVLLNGKAQHMMT